MEEEGKKKKKEERGNQGDPRRTMEEKRDTEAQRTGKGYWELQRSKSAKSKRAKTWQNET